MLLRVLTISVMVFALAELSVEDNCGSEELPNNSSVTTVLEGVSDALHCFKNVFQESVQDNKKSNDNLEKLVLELKGEIINLWAEECNISQLNKLAGEKDELKTQLAEKELQVQELQRKLKTSLKEEEKVITFTVSIEPQEKKLKNDCELAKQPNIAEYVEDFSWSRDWDALQEGLGAVASNSTPYKQMQRLGSQDSHPLFMVGLGRYTALATFLVCGGLVPDARDEDGDGILHGAASGGQVRTASVLLDLGADINAYGSMGRTPLMFAVQGDRLEMVKLLVERGASLNATSSNSDTVLHFAAREKKMAMLRYIVAAGADTTAQGSDGHTALSVAQESDHEVMINYLSQFPH